MGESAARALKELVETIVDLSPEAYPRAVLDGLALLLEHQPAMAPITNMANAVYLALPHGPARVVETLSEVGERLAASPARIARSGRDLIPDRSTVLTHSSSSSVRAVLLEARRTRRLRVCCTEALPEGEGVVMAADLAALGFEVEVIPDDAVTEALPGADLVMVGVDALGPDGAINKVGTRVLAREAERVGIPFYLVASQEKVLPAPLFERAATGSGADEFFEVIAFSLVSGVVTEEGVLPASELGGLATSREVASELLAAEPG